MEVKIKELFLNIPPYLADLFSGFEYPWEILPKIGEYINELISSDLPGYTEIKKGVFVGENVKIYDNVTIEGPVILGPGCEVRPGAYIRGKLITGKNCVIGNSSELKNSILLDNVQVPHYNYVGDSILGNHSHMGAGSICSNLKSDKKNIVIHGDREYETNLRKIGAVLGDYADIGCGSVLNPGTIVGRETSVYPLTSVRGVIPSGCIVKGMDDIIKRN